MINIFAFLFAVTFIMGMMYLRYVFMIYNIPKRIEEARQIFETDEKKAVSICNSILSLDKGNPVANWIMAKFHTKYKRYILALMFLNEIIQYARYTPDISEQDVRETVSQLYLYLGNVEKALAQFNILQGRYHIQTSLIKRMVDLLIEMGNGLEAKRLVEKAMESQPGDGELDYIYATILFKQNDHTKALTKLQSAIRKNFRNAEVYQLMGRIQFLGSKYSDAIESLTSALDNIPEPEKEIEIINLLVQCYYNIYNYKSAIELAADKLNTYPQNNPNTTAIRYFTGCCYEKHGDIDTAISYWSGIPASQHYHEEAKRKIEFYSKIAQKPHERIFITQPLDSFMHTSEKLADILGYSIKETVHVTDEIIEYVCSAKDSTALFHQFYFVVSRRTQPVTMTDLKDMSIRKNVNKCKFVVLTALYYKEDARSFAQKKGIQIFDYSVLEKFKLL
jgi:tetratricopeptide (TPR) repeat protein